MADIREDVENAFEEIRPMLQSNGGDVELVEVDENNVVRIRLLGACSGCPMARRTIKEGIERRIKAMVPEVAAVEPAEQAQ